MTEHDISKVACLAAQFEQDMNIVSQNDKTLYCDWRIGYDFAQQGYSESSVQQLTLSLNPNDSSAFSEKERQSMLNGYRQQKQTAAENSIFYYPSILLSYLDSFGGVAAGITALSAYALWIRNRMRKY